MSGYCWVHAADPDPDEFEEYPNGIRVQPIRLVFRDDPEIPIWHAPEPAVCVIDARRARQLAFELLVIAEHAEHLERTGGLR